MPLMEFHISRAARDRYGVRESLFSFSGNVIFANVAGSRELVHRMNQVRGTEDDPKRALHPGALFAIGLIDEVSHLLIEHYRKRIAPQVMKDAIAWFQQAVSAPAVDKLLLSFVKEFPVRDVFAQGQEPKQWLQGATDGVPHREIALEELILLWLANANTAFRPFQELFDDQKLTQTTPYPDVVGKLRTFFATKPPLGADKLNLIDLLRAPALASPDSLSGQLAYIREKWADLIGSDALRRLLLAADVLQEEEIAIWMRYHPPSEEALAAQRRRDSALFGRGRTDLPDFTTEQHEYERFSPDQDWMPNTVLIAKSTYVWLAQLSKWYGRSITRLDQIPDEELDTLARRGLNSLWLIGLWERSRASRTIKRLCGKEDAVASAYSLFDYAIAADLGGESAYRNLRDRAGARGIRLASDMVPNHMGIDSTWVIEHPEWFLSRYDSPYPAYRFEGPDLSSDGRVEIKIEDHYYEQTDAAVVFRRRDKWTGDTRFVYHGNDGTSFPWNDTAQLDYLNPAVREQVIQTILYVARLFPIIRFDAAMTLAKRHIQRLWYPAPGAGGAIPSRAEFSMPTPEFDRRIPVEFWREVVDRVAVEVPGTLLLAEAFWMMEGYFVRTLGMHRVYNSAFMNLLRDEDNQHYRSLLKNTMEFDPGVMKRYVNFMSNPDERTAIDQFGTGDKYFGIATLMATLPGLPMFGHGQVEGFSEKYGMEYYRPRYDETPNQWLVDRHQREIAPLLHNRGLFAESDNFLLYDFWTEDGRVDENVYAYSNRRGGQKALVLYHNRYGTTRGTVHHSTALPDRASGGVKQMALSEGLQLPRDGSVFLGYRDVSTGLEYLRRSTDMANSGFFVELQAYKYHVLLDWRELRVDAERRWDRLHDLLRGTGVPSLDEALINLQLQPVHDALAAYLEPSLVQRLAEISEHMGPRSAAEITSASKRQIEAESKKLLEDLVRRGMAFLREAESAYESRRGHAKEKAGEQPKDLQQIDPQQMLHQRLAAAMCIAELEMSTPAQWPAEARVVLPTHSPRVNATAVWGPVLGWCVLEVLLESTGAADRRAADVVTKLHLRNALAHAFASLGLEGENSWRGAARVCALLRREPGAVQSDGLTADEWKDGDLLWLTGVHDADGLRYFVKEPYEQLLWWLEFPALLKLAHASSTNKEELSRISSRALKGAAAAQAAGYQVEKLLAPAGGRAEAAKLPAGNVAVAERPSFTSSAEVMESSVPSNPVPSEDGASKQKVSKAPRKAPKPKK